MMSNFRSVASVPEHWALAESRVPAGILQGKLIQRGSIVSLVVVDESKILGISTTSEVDAPTAMSTNHSKVERTVLFWLPMPIRRYLMAFVLLEVISVKVVGFVFATAPESMETPLVEAVTAP